jgi:hypothetical protein
MTFINETTFDKVDLPPFLYKYRSWSKEEHKRILTHNEIYFASPFELDELHECKLTKDFESLTEQMVYDYAYIRAEEMGITEEEYKHGFAAQSLDQTNIFDPAFQQQVEERSRNTLNKVLRIFCASEHNDNANLWSSFASGERGVCVGLDTRRMLDDKAILGGGGKVAYYSKDNAPKRRPLCFSDIERTDDMLKVVFSLPDFFSKEDEYRLFKFHLTNQRVSIHPDCIKEVILGRYMSESDQIEIISLVRKKYPWAKITRAGTDELSNYLFQEIPS